MQSLENRLLFSPTDLNGFLSCEHMTTLQLAVARGELAKPFRHNSHAELIRRKGDEHEAAYLARLRGEHVATIDFGDRDWGRDGPVMVTPASAGCFPGSGRTNKRRMARERG